MVKIENLIRTAKWIKDKEEGDFIEARNYCKDYMGFEQISQNELDELCELFNTCVDSSIKIGNTMGEIKRFV